MATEFLGSNPSKTRLYHPDVAQLGRALALGARGRMFESCHPDFCLCLGVSLCPYGVIG